MAREYRLGSSSFVYAPGVIKWAINGYHFKSQRKSILDIVVATWGIPEKTAKALLSEKIPFKVVEETVVFES